MDSKGQDILFNSEMNQKDLMIQMLSERLDRKRRNHHRTEGNHQ